MYRKICLLALPLLLVTLLAGCSSVTPDTAMADSTSGAAPVALSMTDTPPSGVAVLLFNVNLTAASLESSSGSSVSLLPNNTPIQVDVTKLQALSAFLNTADVTAGTYNSLSLTFADPQLVIYNLSDTSLGSSCAVGSVCELTPTVDNSTTVTINSSPFPLTVSSGSPLGLLVDFHLNTIIQSDLSVNLSASDGITVSTLPSQTPHFGFLAGEVSSVDASGNQFTLKTPWGGSFTVDTSSNTTFTNFPSSACSSASLACVQTGQIVTVQISGIASKGVVNASAVNYVQAANQLTVEGTVLGVSTSTSSSGSSGSGSTTTSIKLLLHGNPTMNADLPLGGKALVTLASNATFSIDAQGFTMPSGESFTSASDLTVGQDVTVTISPSSLVASSGPTSNANGWGLPPTPSFTATAIELEPSQITGTVSDLTSTGFTLSSQPSFFCWSFNSTPATATVDTTSQTTFQGFTTEDLSGVSANDVVSVNGWLFAGTSPAAGSTTVSAPTIVAQTVALHSNGWF